MGRTTSKGNEAISKMKHPSDMATPRFELSSIAICATTRYQLNHGVALCVPAGNEDARDGIESHQLSKDGYRTWKSLSAETFKEKNNRIFSSSAVNIVCLSASKRGRISVVVSFLMIIIIIIIMYI